MGGYRKYFRKAIRSNYPAEAERFLASIENHYQVIKPDIVFAKTSSNPIDRRLDFCAYFLALIKSLDEQGKDFETIRKVCLQVVTDYVRPKNKLQALMKRLPARLVKTKLFDAFLHSFKRRVGKKGHPDGFLATIITDKVSTFGLGYGVDILECGICKLYQKHHYEKYASILCEVDELTSGMAGLELVRTSTIALGAQQCDFRYRKK